MHKILFVCETNMVYSPAAQAILKKTIKANGVDDLFNVESAGANTKINGEYPNLATMKKASDMGYFITHRTRKLNSVDLAIHDYIIVMGNALFADLFRRVKDDTQLIKLFPAHDFMTKPPATDMTDDLATDGTIGDIIVLLENMCAGVWEYIQHELTSLED